MNHEHKIIKIVSEYKTLLPQDDIESIVSLANHCEWGLAIENLCTQIYEYQIKISEQSFFQLKKFSEEIGLDSSHVEVLRELIG